MHSFFFSIKSIKNWNIDILPVLPQNPPLLQTATLSQRPFPVLCRQFILLGLVFALMCAVSCERPCSDRGVRVPFRIIFNQLSSPQVDSSQSADTVQRRSRETGGTCVVSYITTKCMVASKFNFHLHHNEKSKLRLHHNTISKPFTLLAFTHALSLPVLHTVQ